MQRRFELTTQHYECRLAWCRLVAQRPRSMVARGSTREREAEITHDVDRTAPMSEVFAEDSLIDLSQSLNRGHCSRSVMPCITPGARLWLRRRCRWLLAPEAVSCQGYAAPSGMRNFTHRQVIDLVGNSFHCDSCLVSLAVAFASTPPL